MAPKTTKTTVDASANPLADYFFIAGIESSQIIDERPKLPTSPNPLQATIEEDKAWENDAPNSPRPSTPGSPATAYNNRVSQYSFEARKSIGSIIGPLDNVTIASKRSSATTIKAPQVETSTPAGLSDEDFEQALRKFASERDSFLEEIQVSAGAIVEPPPQARQVKSRPKTIRIANADEANPVPSRLTNGVGSLRKRLSGMSSLKRNTSTSRQSSIRTTKRMSGYNSVIPAPQPFHVSPDMHPLKRRYEPVMLDRYPTKAMVEENKRRCPFPDYVPMFAFPNDINVVSADEQPRSTWHGFVMTAGDGSKLHCICVTVWMPLNAEASEELERQCDDWRKKNMSKEERELASSLGERLATERAKLSRLLAQLPTIPSGTSARDELQDEINGTEEKIGLMADLLRPVRQGAASKIEGLTEGDTGFWIPRVYGILGRDGDTTSFWKEWLKAVIVPMTNGAIVRVPASSPKVGMWQPLERYVTNLCVEAPSPSAAMTQTEVGIRELRLYARKNAINELPGSRNTDLYALFRCLSIPTIITLFECALAEGRIILSSSHTSMLHLASAALVNLLYPLVWTGVFIPVLPARLLQAVEAPCPYIVGVEKRFDNLELPDDDFVLVDLDNDIVEGTAPPLALPRQQRRKLMSLLQAAAPHYNRYGVQKAPPAYAKETFPNDAFSSENPQVFMSNPEPSTLAAQVSMSSADFDAPVRSPCRVPIFNAFSQHRLDTSVQRPGARPSTATGSKHSNSSSIHSPPSPTMPSPVSSNFPSTPVSRNDSGFGLQAALREKRSGVFDGAGRRSSSFGLDRMNPMRRPSIPFANGHSASASMSTLPSSTGNANYASSIYAPSTLAASTVMPSQLMVPIRETETQKWAEGHCLIWKPREDKVQLVCPSAFRPDLVRAAFVRCFASLFYSYRKFMQSASGERRKAGLFYHFNMEAFIRSAPNENVVFLKMLQETTAFNEFVHERESKRAEDPSIRLFDEIILSKRNRGRSGIFSKSSTSFLSDASDHLWRSAAAAPPISRFPGDYRQIVSRIPAKLDPTLMKEPRATQGAPRVSQARTKRKPVNSMLGLAINSYGEGDDDELSKQISTDSAAT
ncbi:hypothetical protein MBLNU457_g0431t2 [Dothideomycetes sp. NU457]